VRRFREHKLLLWTARGLLVLACLFPLYWIVNVALSSPNALYKRPLDYFPNPAVGENFRAVFDVNQFPRNIANSFAVASLTTLLTLALGAPAAYALARLRVKYRGAILAVFLGIAIFPAIGMIGPLYVAMARLGLINRYPSLVLPYTLLSLPLAVWILTHFFSTLPTSLEDAAMVDREGLPAGNPAHRRPRRVHGGGLDLHLRMERVPLRADTDVDTGGPDRPCRPGALRRAARTPVGDDRGRHGRERPARPRAGRAVPEEDRRGTDQRRGEVGRGGRAGAAGDGQRFEVDPTPDSGYARR